MVKIPTDQHFNCNFFQIVLFLILIILLQWSIHLRFPFANRLFFLWYSTFDLRIVLQGELSVASRPKLCLMNSNDLNLIPHLPPKQTISSSRRKATKSAIALECLINRDEKRWSARICRTATADSRNVFRVCKIVRKRNSSPHRTHLVNFKI